MGITTILGKAAFITKKTELPEEFNPERILVLRSGSIGDVIMTTPLVSCLRKKWVSAKIDYAVGEYSKEVLEDNPDISEVIVFDPTSISKGNIASAHTLANTFKTKKYDLAIILDKHWIWQVIAALAKIPVRVGFDRKGEGFSLTKAVPFNGSKNEKEYNLEIAKALDVPITVTEPFMVLTHEQIHKAKQLLAPLKKPIIAVAPGGAKNPLQTMDSKRPKKPKYAKICSVLQEYGTIVFVGSEDDSKIIEYIQQMSKGTSLNLAGKLTLRESAAVLEQCDLVVTHDTGLMHVAAAVKTPTVAMFGATKPERFAPDNIEVVDGKSSCQPCYDIYGKFNKQCTCIDTIKPEEVTKKAIEILKNRKR